MNRAKTHKRGFQISELIIVIFLVSLSSLVLLTLGSDGYRLNRNSGKRLSAQKIAQRYLTKVKADPTAYAPSASVAIDEQFTQTHYTGTLTVERYPGTSHVLQAKVDVHWNQGRTLNRVHLEELVIVKGAL